VEKWKLVEQQIEELNDELERISAADAGCTRIRKIPGIGPVVATAIVASIGNGAAFSKGREFAAWLGIVPRHYSTGGKAKLFGISKRGNAYLRRILIHGARWIFCAEPYVYRRYFTEAVARPPRCLLSIRRGSGHPSGLRIKYPGLWLSLKSGDSN
jgi:Transposase IS116/IS110/IS902 family